ncbi:MAG: ribosomal protein S18-alanine N-acetyltransferase [Desulfatiglans sp.]|jgi:ribosomal-protein-alanine N-acetyltransferase|nr:ribosomal protein S18-alanine N-acetyltransferase [Thermodesulfobacteriota bacterium]MEE4353760.1 ribosomal protein S18-alanine N-acetyltransferase [Desulfatiglans sp.]
MILLTEIREKDFPLFESDILLIEKSSFLSPWSIDSFKEEVTRTVSHLWVLLADGIVTGYICFWMFADEIHLMNIAVHGKRRKQGLGHLLLSKMIDQGRSNRIQGIWLEVRPSNSIARGLYRKAGFVETGRRRRYYRDTGEDAIIMTLYMTDKEIAR